MKRCIRLSLALLILSALGCASPRGRVVPLKVAFDEELPRVAVPKIEDPVFVQPSSVGLAAIPSDKDDAAVFYFSLGQAYSLDNDTDRAIEAYRATLVYDPNSPLVHARLAAELIKQGNLSEARELCEKAIKLDSRFIDSYLLLAGIQVAAKEYKQALATYRRALGFEPDNRDALLYYGVTLAEVGRNKEAIEKLQKLVSLKETSQSQVDELVAYYYLAKVQQQAELSREAVKTLKTALEKRPGFVKAALLLAEIYASQNQEQLARKTLEDVFKESPDAEVASQLADDFLNGGNYQNAVVYLETLVDEDPTNENLRLKLGLVYWQLRWLDKAYAVFNEILSRHPSSSDVLFYMAELSLEKDGASAAIPFYERISADHSKYEAAISRLVAIRREQKKLVEAGNVVVEALEKRSDIVAFYPLLAALYEEESRLSDAREILEIGKKRFPQEESILYYLGFIYDKMGERDKGFMAMEEILQVNPANANALNFLGYTLIERGEELDRAEQYLTQAFRLKPNDAYIIDSYAWMLHKRGRHAEAMQYLERAHGMKPEEVVIVEHLGDVYLALSMKEKALDAYRLAYSMSSQDKKIGERLAVKIANVESALMASNADSLKKRRPAMARPDTRQRFPASVE